MSARIALGGRLIGFGIVGRKPAESVAYRGQHIALEPAAAASLVHPPMSVARLWRHQGKRTPARERLALV
jgi:hypothetical protein